MPTRTKHQARNQQQRRKLNAACSFKGDKEQIPEHVLKLKNYNAHMMAAVIAAALSPLFRRSGGRGS